MSVQEKIAAFLQLFPVCSVMQEKSPLRSRGAVRMAALAAALPAALPVWAAAPQSSAGAGAQEGSAAGAMASALAAGAAEQAMGAAQAVPDGMALWAQIAVAVLVLAGAGIALLGSLGLLRLPTYFERVHAPSIIATLGCWLTLWGSLIFFYASGQGLRLHIFMIAVFVAVTVPITTIFLMRAALFRMRLTKPGSVPPSLSRMVPVHQPPSPIADELNAERRDGD